MAPSRRVRWELIHWHRRCYPCQCWSFLDAISPIRFNRRPLHSTLSPKSNTSEFLVSRLSPSALASRSTRSVTYLSKHTTFFPYSIPRLHLHITNTELPSSLRFPITDFFSAAGAAFSSCPTSLPSLHSGTSNVFLQMTVSPTFSILSKSIASLRTESRCDERTCSNPLATLPKCLCIPAMRTSHPSISNARSAKAYIHLS